MPPACRLRGQRGRSLGRIALKLGIKLPDLLSANDMTVNSLIVPGQQLVVPQAPSGGGSAGSYTVKAGDSLSMIASRHKVSLAALLAANGMTASSLIMPGMTLARPAGAVTATTTANATTTASATYTVKAGDSLSASPGATAHPRRPAGRQQSDRHQPHHPRHEARPAGRAVAPSGSSSNGSNSSATGAAGGSYTVKAGDSLEQDRRPQRCHARAAHRQQHDRHQPHHARHDAGVAGRREPGATAEHRISRQPGRASTRCSNSRFPSKASRTSSRRRTPRLPGLTRRLRPDRDQPRAPERGQATQGTAVRSGASRSSPAISCSWRPATT